nr:hypothetical protein [Tanacetum cinerariifolium]
FCCSKRNVEDKILVPKLPKNYARCARCGHPVNGPYCQGCTLLREKLEEDLVTYFQNFQNTFESSDGSTNVVNAPREPFVVKQDHGINPPHIDECCCECGDALDGIFCQQCTCMSCGKGAHIGYSCPSKVLIISNPELCNQTMNNELRHTLPSFYPTCYSDKENSVPCVSKPNFVDESSNIFNPPPQHPIYSYEFCGSNAQYGHYCTPQVLFINPEPVTIKTLISRKIFTIFNNSISVVISVGARTRLFNIPACCDDDDDYNSAITPVLSTEKPDNSLSLGDEHLNTILATESDEPKIILRLSQSPTIIFLLVMTTLSTMRTSKEEIEDDNLCEKLLNVHLIIANIEALKDNPTPSFKLLTKSSSTSPKSFLEETNTFHNSLPEFETFCFDLEEISKISSGSATTHFDISLPDYEAFYFDDDHIKEISSGNTTTHSDISLSEYDSFIFDLSNDQFLPINRSDFTHEEFGDELAHIISPPEYDRFYF